MCVIKQNLVLIVTFFQFHNSLRSYEIVFYALFLCGHCFIQYRFIQYTSLYFLPILLENQCFCLLVLFVFTTWSEFDVLFINFCNIYIIIIYIVSVKCFCSQLSLLTQFVRTDTRMTIISFNKKTCFQGAFEF